MVQVHLGPRTHPRSGGGTMKKLFALALLAVVGYAVYQQAEASKAEQDLWSQATGE